MAKVFVVAVARPKLPDEDGVPAGQRAHLVGMGRCAGARMRPRRYRDGRDAHAGYAKDGCGDRVRNAQRLRLRMTVDPPLQQQQILAPVDVAVQQVIVPVQRAADQFVEVHRLCG